MPLVWIFSVFYNLFFVIQKNNDNIIMNSESESSLFHRIKNNFLNLNRNLNPRKKPKIRKSPILIKNNEKNDRLKNKFNRKDIL